MPNKKQVQADKHKKMTSLTLYLKNQAAEKADKLLFRQAKRQAKIDAENEKKNKKQHIHTDECGKGCNHEH